jgi:hypothetical protein
MSYNSELVKDLRKQTTKDVPQALHDKMIQGDLAARNQLITNMMPLAIKLTDKFLETHPGIRRCFIA